MTVFLFLCELSWY